MKSKIIKILLSSVLSVWLIAWTVFALNTVNTWDTLTASSWNEIVNKLTSFDTNSTDLVTKSYVDSSIVAAGWETCYVSSPKVNADADACITGFSESWTFSTATPTWARGRDFPSNQTYNIWWATFTNKIARVCCK